MRTPTLADIAEHHRLKGQGARKFGESLVRELDLRPIDEANPSDRAAATILRNRARNAFIDAREHFHMAIVLTAAAAQRDGSIGRG